MVKHVLVLGLVVSMMLLASTVSAEPDLNPGKWEIVTETDMAGMPMKMPPVTYTQCLTKEDFIPKGKQASNECRVTDIKEEGNTVSWKISCSGENGKMEGSGHMTYDGDTMHGTMNFNLPDAGMTMKNTLKGRKIGDCD